MKVLVLGYVRMSGVGKESKKPYDFARLCVANPVQERASEKSNVTGDGFEQAYVDLQLGAEGQFRGLKFPVVLDLKIEHQLGRTGRMEAICVGYLPPAKASAA